MRDVTRDGDHEKDVLVKADLRGEVAISEELPLRHRRLLPAAGAAPLIASGDGGEAVGGAGGEERREEDDTEEEKLAGAHGSLLLDSVETRNDGDDIIVSLLLMGWAGLIGPSY